MSENKQLMQQDKIRSARLHKAVRIFHAVDCLAIVRQPFYIVNYLEEK